MTKKQKPVNHFDDSALLQGRKVIGVRKLMEHVNTANMTPKEYLNYKAGIWDGVERNENAYNFTPHIWESDKEEAIDKRTKERRINKLRNKNNRRSKAQRSTDKLDLLVYRICFNFSVLTLLFLGVMVIIFNTIVN